MKLNQLFFVLISVFTASIIAATQTGCANIVPPTGGPRDSLPPVLVNVTPGDSTIRFTGKKIVLSFNEYVQLDNIQKNLIVSPTPKVPPTVEQKLRTITVTIRDTLEENTTYIIDFGNAIKDLNEGNPFRDYRYLFSTGATLDSLKLSGKVLIAESGKVDSTLIVMLYTDHSDSAVIKERSRYLARVDTLGNFRFNNLAPGNYSLYALKDDGGSRRYLSKDQLFAFNDSLVSSQSQRSDLMLYAFVEKDTSVKPVSTISEPDEPKKGGKEQRVLRYQPNLDNGQLDLLSNLTLSFSPAPLRVFDSAKIVLTDTSFRPLNNYSVKRDTSLKKVIVTYPWVENTDYRLLVDSSFAADSAGRKLAKTDTIVFQTKPASDYGLIKFRFLGLQLDRNPVLQFTQNDQVKHSHVFTNNIFEAKLFAPGEYELRILFDENKNGEWDTGQFFGKKRQPEKVQRIPAKITIRPNWDNERDIEL